MKTTMTMKMKALMILAALAPMTASAVWPPPKAEGDELAVWRAMAGTISRDNEAKPYKLWYAESDFAAASFIASALWIPTRSNSADCPRPT